MARELLRTWGFLNNLHLCFSLDRIAWLWTKSVNTQLGEPDLLGRVTTTRGTMWGLPWTLASARVDLDPVGGGWPDTAVSAQRWPIPGGGWRVTGEEKAECSGSLRNKMEALFCPVSLACGLLNEVTLAWTPPLSPLAPFPQYINTFGTLEYCLTFIYFFGCTR